MVAGGGNKDGRDLSGDDYWARLNEDLAASSQSYDRTVLTLSGGALIVSIAFIRDIAPEPSCLGLIVAAWGFLLVSLAATLFSHISSEKALLHSMDLYRQGGLDQTRGGTWGTVTDVLNRVAGGAFFVAALLLVWFAVVNLPEGA